MPKITVFTPTYNRAYIIENLYRSLLHQQTFDFEWLVVDDGSNDNTRDLFERLMAEQPPFPIRYYYKENGGKHRAINYALDLAAGELFFVVDSDDYLTDDALAKIILWEADLPNGFAGVAGNLGTAIDITPNTLFDVPYVDDTLFARYADAAPAHLIDGERAIVFYTEVHRRYKYPEFEDEKFMTEAVTWNRMARDGYKMRFYNDIIWIYEYKDDGLTRAGFRLFQNNPRGYALFQIEKTGFLHPSRRAQFYCRYALYADLHTQYNTTTLTEILQTSKWTVRLLALLWRIKHIGKRRDT